MYCLAEDVIRELPWITITDTTKPSMSEVYQFCQDITSDMDSRLRAVDIIVPVADEDLKRVLRGIAINGVAAKTLRANPNGEFDNSAVYEDLYQKAMARIEAHPSIVREEAPLGASGTERSDDDIHFGVTREDW